MRSLFQHKRWILLVSVLALGALTVLAIGLRDVSFGEAQRFGRGEAQNAEGPPQNPFEGLPAPSLESQILLWVSFFLLVLLIGVLLSRDLRKRFIRLCIRLAFTYWALYLFLTHYGESFASLGLALRAGTENQPAIQTEALPPPVFRPPQETAWISYLVGLLLILLIAFLAWRFSRFWREHLGRSGGESLDEIARIARSSLREISSGRESTDVILTCYFRMSDVVADKRKLKRSVAMTPAEFAMRLEQAGLPGEAVKKLTGLFESVRYGAHRSGPKEVNEAVACLTTILHYCGETI